MKTAVIILFLICLAILSYGTSWPTAYPYKQRIEGQKVRLEAIAYNPHEYATTPVGKTNVYYDNELLYSINKYYRHNIYTSEDGHYFAIVYSDNDPHINEFNKNNGDQINFNSRAIDIFKEGILLKSIFLREIMDTEVVVKNGKYFNWSYYFDVNGFRDAKDGCKYCQNAYGLKSLKKLDTSDIDSSSFYECKRQCDSTKISKRERNIAMNATYVEGNVLHIVTRQGIVVSIDFNTLVVQRLPFNTVVPDKESFHPPKLIRKYNKLKIPEKFDLPNLADGRKFEDAVASLFGLESEGENEIYDIFISPTIDREGHCIKLEVTVHDLQLSESYSEESINKGMSERVYTWCRAQLFSTRLIPKGFEKYGFYGIVRLYNKEK